MLEAKYNLFFSCSHCYYTIFILSSYSLHTKAMLILILISVQYLQIVIFTFGKPLNYQENSSSDSHQAMKQSPTPRAKFLIPPLTVISDFPIPPITVTLFEKPWTIFKWGEGGEGGST